MKNWKQELKSVQGVKEKKESNQIVREAGFGDTFFYAAAQARVKVDSAKLIDRNRIRITFRGVTGNTFSVTEILNYRSENGPSRPDEFSQFFARIHAQIRTHNRAIGEPTGAVAAALTL